MTLDGVKIGQMLYDEMAKLGGINVGQDVEHVATEREEQLEEWLETIVMYVKSDGTRYWVDEEGNQHFDATNSLENRQADRIEKLEELVQDLLVCLTWQIEPHSYMMDGCDHCRYRGKTNGMCGLGMFRGRVRDFGIEVDG